MLFLLKKYILNQIIDYCLIIEFEWLGTDHRDGMVKVTYLLYLSSYLQM